MIQKYDSDPILRWSFDCSAFFFFKLKFKIFLSLFVGYIWINLWLFYLYTLSSHLFFFVIIITRSTRKKKNLKESEKNDWLMELKWILEKNSWTGPSSFWVKNALCWAFILCNILPAAYFFFNISYWIRFKEIFFFNI